MFVVRKIENVPNPAIPQWRVYNQDKLVAVSVRILKSNNRSWNLYTEEWGNNQWTLIKCMGETTSQAQAYCEAGAFLERMYQNTGSQGPEDTFPEDHWR